MNPKPQKNKFFIKGAPGAGKTTIIHKLRDYFIKAQR